MPRSPKKTAKTGSVLLGRELRRLRGTRTLKEVADIAQRPPLDSHVASLSESGLSEIESGKSMPTLGSLHALSVIYKTSMSHLMAHVTEERLGSRIDAQGSGEELSRTFATLLDAHDWPGALAIAQAGERRATDERERTAWRANRASCLSRQGLLGEAILILTECCESAALSDEQRYFLLHNLAVAHHNAGHAAAAGRAAREALELGERAALPPEATRRLELQRAIMIVEFESQQLQPGDSRRLREAMRLVERARSSWPSDDAAGQDMLAIVTARIHHGLGNSLLAGRDLESIADDAGDHGRHSTAACALLSLASVRYSQGRDDDALGALSSALEHADQAAEPDSQFEASFRLFLHHRRDRPGVATSSLHRCQALFPLVSAMNRWCREYEIVMRSRS